MTSRAGSSLLCLFPEQSVDGLEDFRHRHIYHPGRSVPFHVTLLYSFLPPDQIDDTAIQKLTAVARQTPRFSFQAKPQSSFAERNVLCLTPSPIAPFEKLTSLLYKRSSLTTSRVQAFPLTT